MHFFYLDETGCQGTDLNPGQEPIFVIGGISVKDQGWVATTEAMERVIEEYFDPNPIPDGFELHAHELLSPNGDGPFAGHARNRRNELAFRLLDLIADRSHHVHYVAIDKAILDVEGSGNEHLIFNAKIPYLLGFDYMTTLINHHVKDRLGHTARGIIILDEKPQFDDDIARVTRYRRFEVAKARRIKWLVEFSYSIDSQKHPMIQLTDLVIFCVKKFYEMNAGYRDNWPGDAKTFFAQCFDKLYSRVVFKSLIDQDGRHANDVNALLHEVTLNPGRGWKDKYGIQRGI